MRETMNASERGKGVAGGGEYVIQFIWTFIRRPDRASESQGRTKAIKGFFRSGDVWPKSIHRHTHT